MVGSYWVCHWKKTFWVGGCDGIGGLAYLLFCAAYWSRQPRVFRRLSRSCYHFSKLRCRRYLKSFLVEDRPVEQILHIPYQDCWYPINARSQSSVCLGARENVMGHAVWPCTLTPNLLKCHAWQYCCTWLSHNCMINWYRSAADTMAYIWMALDHQQTLLYWQNTGQEHMILVFVITFWIFFLRFPSF